MRSELDQVRICDDDPHHPLATMAEHVVEPFCSFMRAKAEWTQPNNKPANLTHPRTVQLDSKTGCDKLAQLITEFNNEA